MTRAPAVLGLAAVYLAALGHAAPADVAFSLVVGFALVSALGGPRGPRPAELARRVAAFPAFALAAAASVAGGTLRMLLVVLGLRTWRSAGTVEVPIGERTALGIAVSGLVATLSPGSLFISVDRRRGTLAFHLIDATDPDAFRERLERFYRRYQRHVFP